ncbi:clarin-3 [Sphaerodactylus townsendi]|uniref:clarin-3 n=1 Tax=Sphaerodactylus townsendi TaxID=933632 RepID=UPI002026B31D|nr:clarin-3 [Sphaerodactylus townsendi]
MPSKRKSLMFASACFTSICSFVIICLVLATKNWVSSKISFSSGTVNTTLIYRYGLFEGHLSTTVVNGITKPESSFQVADSLNNGTVKSLNIMIIFLLVLSLLSSFLSAGFTCYNAVSNPYQTFLGPIGVYTWNSISGFCIFLALILFAVNVEANKLSVELASTPSPPSRPYKLSNSYGYSYWIMLLIVFLNVATIIIIVFYQKARYSKRKEQQRPMESAPKDGILF